MVPDIDSLAGRVIGGFQLERLIGTGGMGAVFLAQPMATAGDAVALKLLVPPWQITGAEREEFRRRFRREAETLHRLRHPHIVPVLTFGQDAGWLFMAMPYLVGGSLAQQRGHALAFAEVVSIVTQLAAALDYAHAQGVVHRDLKPANVLLDAQGRVYLADFGIVRLFDVDTTTLTATGQAIGTPAYMAPEQAHGDAITPAVDRYSLGVLTYELLTGRIPFQATRPEEMLRQHLMVTPPSVRDFRPDVSPAAAAVIARMLAKDPQARFATAGEFAANFGAALLMPPLGTLAPDVADGAVTALSPGAPAPRNPNDLLNAGTAGNRLTVADSPLPIPAMPPPLVQPLPPGNRVFAAAPLPLPEKDAPAPLAPAMRLQRILVAVLVVLVLILAGLGIARLPKAHTSTSIAQRTSIPVVPTATSLPPTATTEPLPPAGSLLFDIDTTGNLTAYNTARKTVWHEAQTALANSGYPPVMAQSQGTLYVNNGGTMFAYDERDGTSLWQQPTCLPWDVVATPTLVLVGCNDYTARLIALDPQHQGNMLWTFNSPLSSAHISATSIADNIVYFNTDGEWDSGHNNRSNNSAVIAIDLTTGKQLWQKTLGGAYGLPPLVSDGVVYAGTGVTNINDQSWLYALNASNGSVKWRTAIDTPPSPTEVSLPLLSNGVLYITDSYGGNFYAVHASDGNILWEQQLPSQAAASMPPLIYKGLLDLETSGSANELCAYTPSGQLQWSDALPGYTSNVYTPVSVWQGALVVATTTSDPSDPNKPIGGQLTGANPTSGGIEWAITSKAGLWAPLVGP